MVKGYESAKKILDRIILEYSLDNLLIQPFGEESDGIGFRIKPAERIFISISTSGGELDFGVYDYQISIIDDSLENGDILRFGIGYQEDVIQAVKDCIKM